MKRLVREIIVSIILVGILLGIIWLLGTLVNWLCVDRGRFVLGMIILIYAIYRQLREELDK